jgi:hypothetical protein
LCEIGDGDDADVQPAEPLARTAETGRAGFAVGRLVATPGALDAVPLAEIAAALDRHRAGDWGDVSNADRAANDASLSGGRRLMSAYRTEAGVTFWVITEADRSATTILLPDEY